MQHHFIVRDMLCGNCEQAITQAVKALDSEAIVRVDRANNSVDVSSIEPRDTIAEAIAEEGYTIG